MELPSASYSTTVPYFENLVYIKRCLTIEISRAKHKCKMGRKNKSILTRGSKEKKKINVQIQIRSISRMPSMISTRFNCIRKPYWSDFKAVLNSLLKFVERRYGVHEWIRYLLSAENESSRSRYNNSTQLDRHDNIGQISTSLFKPRGIQWEKANLMPLKQMWH